MKAKPILVRCKDRECRVASCEHRRPHETVRFCGEPMTCYDRKPPVAGGVIVWCEAEGDGDEV